MINFLLLIIAILLFSVFSVIGFLYAIISNFFNGLSHYFWLCALSLDQSGNTFCKKLFNDTLIQADGHPFGNPNETVSYVLGVNLKQDTISRAGKVLSYILHLIDKNHVQKAADTPQ